jgi:predicted metal-dependent peptidase
MLERISKITERWFLNEEALFSVFCTHRVAENSGMECHARVGKGIIEVNPDLCAGISDKELEERLRVEVIRILLKHPYDRQPDGCGITARALGSNCVIGDSYRLQKIEMEKPADFKLPSNGHFEFYARCIQKLLQALLQNSGQGQPDDNSGDNGQQSEGGFGKEYTDIAANWQQDDLMTAQVNEVIRDVKSWGSLPGQLVEDIIASTKARVDYRKILAGFRASILSEKRKLTRMRPNRRSGFDTMGSRYDFTTRMIIGVDCSGSISKDDLQNFYSTINRFFQYGIQQIDVVQFDTGLGEVQTLLKASENIKVTGRGGTCFQPFIDFVAKHPEYDGALIYTDGYAAQPTIPVNMRTPLCWLFRSESELKKHEHWMRQSGRVCVIETP